jgi:hypothetical protein
MLRLEPKQYSFHSVLYAEMGDISDFEHAGQLIKLAGTNPIVKQSGGKNLLTIAFLNREGVHSET